MESEPKPKWRTSTLTWGVILGCYLVISVVVLTLAPPLISDLSLSSLGRPATATAVVAARTSAFQSTLLGLGGFLAVITLLITVQRDNTNRQRLEHERQKHDADVKAQRDQLDHLKATQQFEAKKAESEALTQHAQLEHLKEVQALEARKAENDRDATVTGRFAQAVAQLGDATSVAIRLGGIYSLQRIALDSAKDGETVLLVLLGFIREASPAKRDGFSNTSTPPLATDIGAALRALTRLSREVENIAPGLSLERLDLHGAQLARLQLETVQFVGTDLFRADLGDAALGFANFRDANLDLANLDRASLQWSVFDGATAILADFRAARMHYTALASTDLQRADFTRATLEGADFTEADLREAKFHLANLEGSVFSGARLEGAQFTGGSAGTSALSWDAEQFARAASWDAETRWPDGYTPEQPVRVFTA